MSGELMPELPAAVQEAAASIKRLDLGGPLKGRHILVDVEQLDCGLIEDMQSPSAKVSLDAIASVMKGGDLPKGANRDGLRKLKLPELKSIVDGVMGLFDLPKGS